MWSPIKIQMKNLFSHPDSQYEFKQGACTVIFGRNLSDRSLENNGAGKTTLFEAVCLALTGDSLRKIDKEVFINDAATQCDISFEMYNAVLKMNLRIERHFYRGGKSSRVELYENGIQNTQLVSVAETNKRILDLLGISREDLLRYYIISQDNHYTFFNASDGEKKEIMNRITSADMIIPVQEEIDRRLGIEQEKRATLQRELDKLSERKATLEEQAEELTAENADDGAAWTELEEKARCRLCEVQVSFHRMRSTSDAIHPFSNCGLEIWRLWKASFLPGRHRTPPCRCLASCTERCDAQNLLRRRRCGTRHQNLSSHPVAPIRSLFQPACSRRAVVCILSCICCHLQVFRCEHPFPQSREPEAPPP